MSDHEGRRPADRSSEPWWLTKIDRSLRGPVLLVIAILVVGSAVMGTLTVADQRIDKRIKEYLNPLLVDAKTTHDQQERRLVALETHAAAADRWMRSHSIIQMAMLRHVFEDVEAIRVKMGKERHGTAVLSQEIREAIEAERRLGIDPLGSPDDPVR